MKSAEDVDGCVLAKLGFAGDADGPEDQMVEEVSDEGFESDAEHQVSQVRAFSKSYSYGECYKGILKSHSYGVCWGG